MGQTLTNGIFLPNEGERNCYTGLAGNWRAIDGYIGDYNVHIADAVIHVSQADRDKWDAVDGKADASALTAHTGDTTIHVTAADKQTWDAVTNKANDADVMHLTGDESAAGNKNFQGLLTTIPSASLWPNVSNTTDDITFLGRSVIHIEYKSSGQLTDLSGGAWSVAELGAGCFFFRINNGADIRFKNVATGDVNRIPVVAGTNRFINDVSPNQDNTYDLGSASYRWRTLNGINPGALSLPDINNRVDITGYITDLTGANNLFTPTANGWICIRSGNATKIFIGDSGTNIGNSIMAPTAQYLTLMYPCTAGRGVNISINCTSLAFALFVPSLGHI